MSDFKLGEPIPTGIPGIEPVSREEGQDAANAVAWPSRETIAGTKAAYSDNTLLDQWLLFPMKLGLSVVLASTAMIVSPALMAEQMKTADNAG